MLVTSNFQVIYVEFCLLDSGVDKSVSFGDSLAFKPRHTNTDANQLLRAM